MLPESDALEVDGVPILTAEQGQELAYSFPEGSAMPSILTLFLTGRQVDADALMASLDGDSREAANTSDRALELIELASRRLRAHLKR